MVTSLSADVFASVVPTTLLASVPSSREFDMLVRTINCSVVAKSRIDHWNALTVHDGNSLCSQSHPTKKQRRTRNSILLEEIPATFSKARKDRHRQFKGIHQRVSRCAMVTTRILCIVRKPTGSQKGLFEGIAIAMVQNGLPDHWRDSAMECDFHLRIVCDKMSDEKTAYEKRFHVKFDGPLIPFGPTVNCEPISLNDESKVASIWQKYVSCHLHGICITCGRRMIRRLADRGLRRLRESASLRFPRQTVQALGRRTRWKAVVSTCRRSSQTLRPSTTTHAAKCQPGETPSKMKKKKKHQRRHVRTEVR